MKTPNWLISVFSHRLTRPALIFTGGLIAGAILSPFRFSYITLTASGAPCIYRVDRLMGTTELSLIGGSWMRITDPAP